MPQFGGVFRVATVFRPMCTLVLLRRPGHRWPLLVAANRDELRARPSRPPAEHWPDRPGVVAGLDLGAGGSWLGLNAHRLLAAVLNRRGSLGPAAGKRSRGELVLEALDHATAEDAARALRHLDPDAYRPFNLVVADTGRAFWVRHAGDGEVGCRPLPEGLSILTAGEADDPSCPRIARCRPLFAEVPPPDPERGDFAAWQALLADRGSTTGDPRDAMCIRTEGDYGTVSASLIAVPADPSRPPVWLYADGPPDSAPFLPVATATLRGCPRASP
jgi:uncharacterized protein with NRDE domain